MWCTLQPKNCVIHAWALQRRASHNVAIYKSSFLFYLYFWFHYIFQSLKFLCLTALSNSHTSENKPNATGNFKWHTRSHIHTHCDVKIIHKRSDTVYYNYIQYHQCSYPFTYIYHSYWQINSLPGSSVQLPACQLAADDNSCLCRN